MKKILCLTLAMCLLFGAVGVNAAGHSYTYNGRHHDATDISGQCGPSISYTLYNFDGPRLRLELTGYGVPTSTPWTEYSKDIYDIYIGDGITEIPDNFFADCVYLRRIELPGTLKRIGDNAFKVTSRDPYYQDSYLSDLALMYKDDWQGGAWGLMNSFKNPEIIFNGSSDEWTFVDGFPGDERGNIDKGKFWDFSFGAITIPSSYSVMTFTKENDPDRIRRDDDLTWSFNSDTGLLNLSSGNGVVNIPNVDKENVLSLNVGNGITGIDIYDFPNLDILAFSNDLLDLSIRNCPKLSYISLPDSLRSLSITDSGLAHLTLPAGLQTINISGCSDLAHITYLGDIVSWKKVEGSDSLKTDAAIHYSEVSAGTNQIIMTIGSTTATVFGQTVENDVAPIAIDGKTLLPARFVAENLGATVEYLPEGQFVVIGKDGLFLTFKMASPYVDCFYPEPDILLDYGYGISSDGDDLEFFDYNDEPIDDPIGEPFTTRLKLFWHLKYLLGNLSGFSTPTSFDFSFDDSLDDEDIRLYDHSREIHETIFNTKEWNSYIINHIDFEYDYNYIYGETFVLETDIPVVIDGRTYLPVRLIAEFCGADVDWDGDHQAVIITRKD